jgi:hypothetical protein
MQITKERFTTVALSFVEVEKDYDTEEVIIRTACELADNFYNEFFTLMTVGDIEELRKIFRRIASNCIDWQRLNRKAHPREYADGAWRMAEEIAQMEANL